MTPFASAKNGSTPMEDLTPKTQTTSIQAFTSIKPVWFHPTQAHDEDEKAHHKALGLVLFLAGVGFLALLYGCVLMGYKVLEMAKNLH